MLLTKAKQLLFDVLFPPLCLICNKSIHPEPNRRAKEVDYTPSASSRQVPSITSSQGQIEDTLLCKSCASKIVLNTTLFCPVCRARLAENRQTCNHSKINYPSTYYLAAAGNYNDPILKALIHALKYQKITALAPTLGTIMERYLNNVAKTGNCASFETSVKKGKLKTGNCIIVPIPLHPRRERNRGFNQAKLLADELKKQLGFPVEEPLIRTRFTSPQMELKGNDARKANVKNCFAIQPNADVRGKTILLIDDVFTSGATMNEAVNLLKEHGAQRIIAMVLAKT